jgi:hypothetical protein
MSYYISSNNVFRKKELIAIIAIKQSGVRSHLFLEDGSVVRTFKKPKTCLIKMKESDGKAINTI